MGERIRRVKVRKHVSGDKDSLIGQGIHSPLPISRQCSAIPRKAGSVRCNGYLGRQTLSPQTSPPSFFTQLYMLSTTYGMEYRCGQLGPAVLAVSPPNSLLHPPAHSLAGWGEKQKRP